MLGFTVYLDTLYIGLTQYKVLRRCDIVISNSVGMTETLRMRA